MHLICNIGMVCFLKWSIALCPCPHPFILPHVVRHNSLYLCFLEIVRIHKNFHKYIHVCLNHIRRLQRTLTPILWVKYFKRLLSGEEKLFFFFCINRIMKPTKYRAVHFVSPPKTRKFSKSSNRKKKRENVSLICQDIYRQKLWHYHGNL